MGSSSMGGQWVDGVGMWGGPGGMEGKGGSGGSSGSMGMWDEAVKNQSGLRGNSNNNMGLKNSRSSPSLRYLRPDQIQKNANSCTQRNTETVFSPITPFLLHPLWQIAL